MTGNTKAIRLATRAGMDIFQFNTGVVRSDDTTCRIGVGSGRTPWGDHVGVTFMREGEETWFAGHFSPAKARVLAQHLIDQADRLDEVRDK